jgi:hypothetical protein
MNMMINSRLGCPQKYQTNGFILGSVCLKVLQPAIWWLIICFSLELQLWGTPHVQTDPLKSKVNWLSYLTISSCSQDLYIYLQYLPVLVGFCTHNPCSFVGSKHFTPGYTVASPSPAQEFAAKTRLELTRLKTLQLPGSSLYSSACYLTDAIRTVVACVTRRENPMKHRGFMV